MGRPLLLGLGFEFIDLMAHDDPVSGKRLLYWGSGFQPIKVQELAEDRMSFVSGSEPTDLIWPNPVEEPFQGSSKRLGYSARQFLFLFYSGDNCCGPDAHYGVMVARSTSDRVVRDARGSEGVPHSLMLFKSERWLAPGHNSIVIDKGGRSGSSITRST
jgi:arabinan endo-1,5-alpha-L-arabinosidase